MALSHIYTQTVADGTATSVVRPSDWNSVHKEFMTLSGNTAGNSSFSATNIIFAGGSNVTLSASTDVGVATVSVIGNVGSISAGTTSASLGQVVFSNSNGVSFGMNNGVITATVTPGAAAGIGAIAAGTQTATSGTIAFADSNGISFGMSGSNQITATYTVPSTAGLISAVNLSAGTTSNNLSAFTFNNGNNVSFGLNGSVVTGSVATSLTNINVSAGTTSNNLSALTFNNSNGVSFGLNGSVVTATVQTNYLTTARASNDAIGLNTAQTNVTWTVNSSGLSLNAAGYAGTGTSATNATLTLNSNGLAISVANPAAGQVNFSAGTTSNNLGSVVFSNANGVSFGLNGSTITASAAGGGGGATLSRYYNLSNVTLDNAQQSNGTASMVPFNIPNYLAATNLHFGISLSGGTAGNNSAGMAYITAAFVMYTLNSDTFSSIASGSQTYFDSYSSNAIASHNAMQGITIPISGSTLFPPDNYWIGLHMTKLATGTYTVNTTSLAQAVSMMNGLLQATGALGLNPWGNGLNASQGAFIGMGIYPENGTSETFGLSLITQSGTRGQKGLVWLDLRNETLW